MKSVFEYTDYRCFLKDFYIEKKAKKQFFSHRFIADKVGFKSGGHFSQILSGKANISIIFIEKFVEFLKLNKRQGAFFQNMVLFNQAKSHSDKKRYFEKMMLFKEASIHLIDKKHYEFYDKWYYSAIRTVLSFYPFKNDYEALAKMISPPVKPSEAKKAVELLERLKLIERNEKGGYTLTEAHITTGYEAKSICIDNHIVNTLDLARGAIDRFKREERNFSKVGLSVSEKGYKAIIEELRNFRRKMTDIVERDENPDRGYLFNFQIFPISKKYRKKGD